MTTEQYQIETARTMADLNTIFDNEMHMALGMVTEAGELADVYKKALAYNKPIDYVNLKEEVGDLLWYISNYCSMNGWTIAEVMELNIKKLRSRFPEKFTQDLAINRNTDVERIILEE